jgi:hypothetical protein
MKHNSALKFSAAIGTGIFASLVIHPNFPKTDVRPYELAGREDTPLCRSSSWRRLQV